ncbi:hypothetical protein PFICI_13221 [Pestalotiopsis fici W106-1]|uniref:Kelch repeat protein n=1 Tax=Pestalotiopsis fici (strain W106-1 / CGMCC3.15140) TaxID=1229662 RepID=W3WNQ0_PESFW|nr:uncharacterized protein PFICI_13221 [Pestalotiopsis fici W106-1]ETS74737.1 hypothetical protein PFICI_13221 [Pestalotiopsis fici W106-1]
MAHLEAQWTQLTANPRLQRSSQCLSVISSQAYIFGGELLPRQPVSNEFDVVTLDKNNEAAATTLPVPRGPAPIPRVGSTTATIDGAIYMFSGRGGLDMAPIEEKGSLWRYDPIGSLWELVEPSDPAAAYPPGRSYHASTSDGAKNIFIHAGCPENGRLSDLWSFNIQTKTWTELEAAPSPPRGGTSLAAHEGKLYRMNGFDGKTEQGGALDVYDIAARSWSTISFSPDGVQGPTPRSVSALLVVRINGREHVVTLFGEGDPSALGHAGAGKMFDDVWAFDLVSQKWSKATPTGAQLPAARGWFDADVMGVDADQQFVIVHGGLAEDNTRLGDVWKLSLQFR